MSTAEEIPPFYRVKINALGSDATRTMFTFGFTLEEAKMAAGVHDDENETATFSELGGLDRWWGWNRPVSGDDLGRFYGTMAKTSRAGRPPLPSLELACCLVKSPKLRGIIANIRYSIEREGATMSEAMGRHPSAFSPEVLAMMKAADDSGTLPIVYDMLHHREAKSGRVIKKLVTGMIYPMFIIVLMFGVIIWLSYVLIPPLVGFYSTKHVALPMSSRIFFAFAMALRSQPLLLLLPVAGIYALIRNWRAVSTNEVLQKSILKVPVFGQLLMRMSLAKWLRTLSILLASGRPVDQSFELTTDSVTLLPCRRFLTNVRSRVKQGEDVAPAFAREHVLLGDEGMEVAAQMRVAGETGRHAEALADIATEYDDHLEEMSNRIDKLMEPLMTALIGSVVGFVVYVTWGPMIGVSLIQLNAIKVH